MVASEHNGSGVDDLMRGVSRAHVARAFIDLALPESLGDRPVSVADLASDASSDPDSMARLLRAAEVAGLCAASGDGFVLTSMGRELRHDAPGNAAGWLLLMTSPWTVRAWERLADAVRSGRPSFAEIHGVGFWEYVAGHPDEAGAFDEAMTSGAVARANDLSRAMDWSSVDLVVDVGGGQGLVLATLLTSVGHLRGLVADRAEVIASPTSAAVELGGRLEVFAADFFAHVPVGGDMYILSRILHDWPDSDAVAILRRCRQAMGSGARLCLLEQIAPDAPGLDPDELFDLAVKDLNMLVLVGGRERTLSEYSRLLAEADLEIDNVFHGEACDVIRARPTI